MLYAGTHGNLDGIEVSDVGRFEKGLLAHLRSNEQEVLDWITTEDPKVKDEAEEKVKAAVERFAKDFA